jgi:uncharacterized lipoprotein YmbA
MRNVFAVCMLGVMALSLTGCITPAPGPESRFYQLQPVLRAAPGDEQPAEVLVRIGPVRVAEYLDQAQMVSRVSEHEVSYDELRRWAGSLDENIAAVISGNVASAVPAVRVVPYTGLPAPDSAVALSVSIYISRLDRYAGGKVVLQASWAVMSKDRDAAPTTGGMRFEKTAASSSTEDVVAMQSELLGDLSREIAADVAAALK